MNHLSTMLKKLKAEHGGKFRVLDDGRIRHRTMRVGCYGVFCCPILAVNPTDQDNDAYLQIGISFGLRIDQCELVARAADMHEESIDLVPEGHQPTPVDAQALGGGTRMNVRVIIDCEATGCSETTDIPLPLHGIDSVGVEIEIEASGWKVRRGKAYCPKHRWMREPQPCVAARGQSGE